MNSKIKWDIKRLKLLIRIAKAADNNRQGKRLGWSAAMAACKKEVKLLGFTNYLQLSKAWSRQSRKIEGYCTACGIKPLVAGKTMCKGCLKRFRENIAKIRKLGRVR